MENRRSERKNETFQKIFDDNEVENERKNHEIETLRNEQNLILMKTNETIITLKTIINDKETENKLKDSYIEHLEQGLHLNNNDEIKQKLIDEINALKEKILEQQKKPPEIFQKKNEINVLKNPLYQQNRHHSGVEKGRIKVVEQKIGKKEKYGKKKIWKNKSFEEEEKWNYKH